MSEARACQLIATSQTADELEQAGVELLPGINEAALRQLTPTRRELGANAVRDA